ncbi:MAG: hypothetical protein V1915_02485 [Candidatus Bathyarchaeota archaeon]
MSNFLVQVTKFFSRQKENFRVLITTSVLNTAIRELVTGDVGGGGAGFRVRGSYIHLYLRYLGADPQQIG